MSLEPPEDKTAGRGAIILDSAPPRRSGRASFAFHGELNAFLARALRDATLTHAYARAATLKQAIESLGVPHTEVGRVTVNDQPATLGRAVRDGDSVHVFPHEPGRAPFEAPLAFAADAHMGGLARMLRMLGFDALYDNRVQDREIVERAAAERRVVLTRDRELLKCRDVLRGCYVHARKAEAQLQEVARRYPLSRHMRPFTLCLHCNLALDPAAPEAVARAVPEPIRAAYARFMHCAGCDRVYWEGSHWTRMRGVLAAALDVPLTDLR